MRWKTTALIIAAIAVAATLVCSLRPELYYHPSLSFWHQLDAPEVVFKRFRGSVQASDLDLFEQAAIEIAYRKLLAGSSRKEVERLLGETKNIDYYNVHGETGFSGFFYKKGTTLDYYARSTVAGDYTNSFFSVFVYEDKVRMVHYVRRWGGDEIRKDVVKYE